MKEGSRVLHRALKQGRQKIMSRRVQGRVTGGGGGTRSCKERKLRTSNVL